ncbi:unnamed protein product, partial [marine sediment metagenome]
VWVRRISMKDSTPYFGIADTFPVPSDPDEIPAVSAIIYPDTATTTSRGLHFTCEQTAEGASVMDSTDFVDDSAAFITGITGATLMTRQPPGCD